MNKLIKIIGMIILCGLVACSRDEVLEKEQYKNVFALISGGSNVSAWVHDLRKPESLGYVSASLGGTNPSTKDIQVSLVEDNRLIDAYNVSNFDVNRSRYIQPLSKSKYLINSYQLTIPAGAVVASIPVKVMPEGLSPDSSYFIALKVDTYSAYEVNPDKDYLLYRVQTKNWWGTNGGSAYNQRGTRQESGTANTPVELFGSKRVYALAPTTVRLLAGSELNDQSNVDIFDNYSLKIDIGDDNKLHITPYKKINMQQIDGDRDFPNIVKIENDGFKTYKTFLLHYSYLGSDGRTWIVKEELRLEFRENPEDPRFLTN